MWEQINKKQNRETECMFYNREKKKTNKEIKIQYNI